MDSIGQTVNTKSLSPCAHGSMKVSLEENNSAGEIEIQFETRAPCDEGVPQHTENRIV